MRKQYTFSGAGPEHVSVIANDIAQARDRAMFAYWGRPDGVVLKSRPYAGRGLNLISVKDAPPPQPAPVKPAKRATGKRK